MKKGKTEEKAMYRGTSTIIYHHLNVTTWQIVKLLVQGVMGGLHQCLLWPFLVDIWRRALVWGHLSLHLHVHIVPTLEIGGKMW